VHDSHVGCFFYFFSVHTLYFVVVSCLNTTTRNDGAWKRDCLLIGGEKQVTKRVDSKDDGEWSNWNWRTEGDLMENGAFFVASGEGMSSMYSKASSVDPKAASLVDQLTRNAGVFGGPRYYFFFPFYPSLFSN